MEEVYDLFTKVFLKRMKLVEGEIAFQKRFVIYG